MIKKKLVRKGENTITIVLRGSRTRDGQKRGGRKSWWWFEIEIKTHQHCWSHFRHYPTDAEPGQSRQSRIFATLNTARYISYYTSHKTLNPAFTNHLRNSSIFHNVMTHFLFSHLVPTSPRVLRREHAYILCCHLNLSPLRVSLRWTYFICTLYITVYLYYLVAYPHVDHIACTVDVLPTCPDPSWKCIE